MSAAHELEAAAELLRTSNVQLQRQLAEFSRALERPPEQPSQAALEDPELARRLAEKQHQLTTATRRLDNQKRTNQELRKKLVQAEDSGRAAHLEQTIAELQERSAALEQENRELAQRARQRTKQISQQETMKDEWPQKLASALADLRVGQDRLQRYRDEEERRGQQVASQKERLRKLVQENRQLETALSEMGVAPQSHGGNGGNRRRKPSAGAGDGEAAQVHRSAVEAELQQLSQQIEALEKEKRADRSRQQRNVAHTQAELDEAKKELADCENRLKEKDKEVRMQHLQVKKLKRALRELALGGAPPSPQRKQQPFHP